MRQSTARLSLKRDDATLLALVPQGWILYLSTRHLWGAPHLLVATAEGGSRIRCSQTLNQEVIAKAA